MPEPSLVGLGGLEAGSGCPNPLWWGWVDSPCTFASDRFSLGVSLGCPCRSQLPGTHRWDGRGGRGQLCVLSRCQSPLLLEHQGPGPLECDGAREREDTTDGSRHPGNTEPSGQSPSLQPCPPAPSPVPSRAHSAQFEVCHCGMCQLVPEAIGDVGMLGVVLWKGTPVTFMVGVLPTPMADPLGRPESPRTITLFIFTKPFALLLPLEIRYSALLSVCGRNQMARPTLQSPEFLQGARPAEGWNLQRFPQQAFSRKSCRPERVLVQPF